MFSVDHCAVMNFLFHFSKKASIATSVVTSQWPIVPTWLATTREQSVIVTSQLPAAGSCIDDVTMGQHFESFGAVTG